MYIKLQNIETDEKRKSQSSGKTHEKKFKHDLCITEEAKLNRSRY